ATAWLGETLSEELQRRNVSWTPVTLAPGTVPAPTRSRHRGSHPEDDHDNLSLPRWTFQPGPLEPSSLTHLDDTVSAVLVPMLLHYYSHNGGWFLGQTMGCAGGARIRVGWAVYDRTTGQPLQWGDVDARELSEAEFSPNSAVLQDFLLAAEQTLQKELRRHLVR
ncbi:MAG: hypothetical protein QGG40_03265, partial [Myxococcota bacterium]|nr:hypothetical protein [Myxococcota bacterium]